MIREEIYNPLERYREFYKEKFVEVAARTFEELASTAQVDIVENKATCDEIRRLTAILKKNKSKQLRWRLLCALLYCLVAGGAYVIWTIMHNQGVGFGMDAQTSSRYLVVTIAATISILFLLIFTVHPKLKAIRNECKSLEENIRDLTNAAWKQMEPLNKLYDWDIFARMMSETVPKLEFDPFFTTQRLEDLRHVYGWDDTFNQERSVLYSHSGLINGNPFVLCRTKKMNMGRKTYYGYKTIHWTTRERNANGKWETVHHSQTLTASYTAPFPEYNQKTRLIYGNIAAPDLCFDRTKNHFSGEEGTLSFKWKLRKLKRQASKKNSKFVLMQNENFEVLFNTKNRNHEQQYRLLFTPLAQASMLDLLRDNQEGYGDDFDFSKQKMINTIVADHIQSVEFDMNPDHYRHYDFEFAKDNFAKLNANYFRAMYFCLAPLLCIPMYQQIRTRDNIYGYGSKAKSAFWEHEALANFWGEEHFKHPKCVTDSILKTSEQTLGDGRSTITVQAYGYKIVRRISYEHKWGGDGKLHTVPVEWDEYLPVVGTGYIHMREDTEDDSKLTPSQRRARLEQKLCDEGGTGVYRRHIASHL